MDAMKKTVSTVLCIAAAFLMCACAPKQEKVPVVSCDNEITVGGKTVATADKPVSINRLDSKAVSLSIGSTVAEDGSVNIINVDPDGNAIKLSDVITDRSLYESAVRAKLDEPVIMTRDSVSTGPEVDREAMEKVMCSYDEAMKLPFLMGNKGVSIIYTEENGAAYTVSFAYDSGVVDSRFVPGDSIMCHSWMTGRVGNGVDGMKIEGYSDHWAENSIQIDNYKGCTYYWFCVAYIDDAGNRTYYSVVAKDTDSGRKVISSQQVEGPFICCNIEEFDKIVDSADR